MKIRNLDLSNNPVNAEHQELGIPPVEESVSHPPSHPVLNIAIWFTGLVLIGLMAFLLSRLFIVNSFNGGFEIIEATLTDKMFLAAVVVGFIAQAVDGALGMAYGITATTFLLSTGASPALASASVHIAEIFTTGFSGISHARLGNVNKSLFLKLLVPGIIGAVAGAIVVTQIDGAILKPYVSAYLLFMGLYILSKALRHIHRQHKKNHKHVARLALLGGFVDSAGGGGWGPVLTTSLLGTGNDPRTTIGSVNFAEFFLALASAASFMILMGTGVWPVVVGLVFGGLFAAPIAALLVSRIHARTLLILVGILISLLSFYNLYNSILAG
jgi:uncharacterized membrane protein YfcA